MQLNPHETEEGVDEAPAVFANLGLGVAASEEQWDVILLFIILLLVFWLATAEHTVTGCHLNAIHPRFITTTYDASGRLILLNGENSWIDASNLKQVGWMLSLHNQV